MVVLGYKYCNRGWRQGNWHKGRNRNHHSGSGRKIREYFRDGKRGGGRIKSIKITGADSGKKGTTVQLSITPDPANADASVNWKSSDEKIATVDANGKVTCVNTGKVTITATSKKDTGKTATFSFQVTADEEMSLT